MKQAFKKAFGVIKKAYINTLGFVASVFKWLKTLTPNKIKNYSLNLISALLIFCVFFGMLFSANPDVLEGIDLFGSKKIVKNIRNLELNMTSVIYVKNDEGKWEEYKRLHGDENRIWISIKKMPKQLQNAFIAIEDEGFREHGGVDWERTFMAVANQLFKFDNTEFGGSTITQQLVKNITADNAKEYTRKAREIIRALAIEDELSKNEILEAYLNTIALGNGINGVQVAANNYFSKNVDELTLAECASIAAITKNPSKYNPVTNMEENTARRKVVLSKMRSLGYITDIEYAEACAEEVKLDFSQKEDLDSEINDYFVDTLIEDVIDDLAEKYECDEKIASTMFYNGGFKIYSTLNPNVQAAMDEVYSNENRYFYEKRRNEEGEYEYAQSAMTIMDYSGHIVGIVGGTGEKTVNRGLNRAYNVPRQPGSTMKPIGVYALAIENDIVDYTSTVLDRPVENYPTKGKWGPKEWFGGYMGEVPLNYALRRSMNAVPVRLLEKVGVDESYNFLTKKLNMKHIVKDDKNPASLALGGCTYGITPTESAAAFAIFGNGGMYYEPTTYYKVVDIDGDVILEPENGKRAIGEDTATIMNHMLREVVYGEGGTGGSVAGFSNTMKAYAKTGTTSDTKDSWLVGGTPYYVGSVWYGFDHNYRVFNTNVAKTIWKDVMRAIHRNLEVKEFEDSEDVYKKGKGYYKDGTTPGKSLSEDEYLPDDDAAESSPLLQEGLTSEEKPQTDESSVSTESTESEETSSETPPIESETPSEPPTDSSEDGTSSESPPTDSSIDTPSEPPTESNSSDTSITTSSTESGIKLE